MRAPAVVFIVFIVFAVQSGPFAGTCGIHHLVIRNANTATLRRPEARIHTRFSLAMEQSPGERNKKLLGAPGIATRNKDVTRDLHSLNFCDLGPWWCPVGSSP